MNFGFTEEQELLRDQVTRFLTEHAGSATVRKIMKSDQGYDAEHWHQMARLGWLGLVIDSDFDGVGLGWVDLIVVLEEMGRSLYPSPFISHTLAASALTELGTEEQKKRLLPALANGSVIATTALLDIPDSPVPENITLEATGDSGTIVLNGAKTFVADAMAASLFIVACRRQGQLLLALVDRSQPGVGTTGSPTMDLTKRTGTLHLQDVKVTPDNLVSIDEKSLFRLFDQGVVAVTAEMVGAAEAVMRITTGYATERLQFGHPIGKYQGVKHRLAEMYVDVESFKSLVYYAAWTVDEEPDALPRCASLAKAYASDAFAQMGIDGVQLHGAIGFTQEYDIQLYLKRSKWARPIFGDADYHYERVARIGQL